MPRWIPNEEWKDLDAYVVGGGESLSSFDWGLLRGKNVIGCNSLGLKHGPEVIPITLFGDQKWWREIGLWSRGKPLPEHCLEEPRWTGEEYVAAGGRLVGSYDKGMPEERSWLSLIHRHGVRAFGRDCVTSGNTGLAAINLALILGARRVFLLGFDMQMVERSNSHQIRCERDNPHVYQRFIQQIVATARSLEKVFPGREIVNVSDVSKLECFPRVSVAEHFGAVRC